MQTLSLRTIGWYALLTAIATGLGALPFARKKTFSQNRISLAQALAAALMITASFGLMYEGAAFVWPNGYASYLGVSISVWGVVFGMLVGLVFILISERILSKHKDLQRQHFSGASAKKMLLIVGIMFLHSFTEGIAIGVWFGPHLALWLYITVAMAIQNIPEGLAISSVMVPRGVSRWKAGLWSIFTSLPQPLMAVPAFLFVEKFSSVMPMGLWFAAGAMIWMSFAELLPDALAWASKQSVATLATAGVIGMILLQYMFAIA